jgi:hypothetical protein
VLARLSKLVLVLALAGSIGWHWALLQAVAWSSMVANYSRELPFSEALAKTFDGKHPCKLCKEIDKAKRSEQKPESSLQAKKLEFRYVAVAFLFQAPTCFWEVRAGDDSGDLLIQAPPTPPPRKIFC